MRQQLFRRSAAIFLLTVGTLALSGCAVLSPKTPEQLVAQRANDYWQARMSGKVDQAYSLSTPSYRKLHTEEQFKKQFGQGVGIEGAEVTKVLCEAERCTATMKISANPALLRMNLGTIATYVDETWILEEGQWWRYQEL